MNEATAYTVSNQRELFIDDYLIDAQWGIERTLHPFQKYGGNPIVHAERPWEGSGVMLYGSVIRDAEEDCWKMWYRSGTADRNNYNTSTNICYAISEDGICWHKPSLGIIAHYNYNKTNIVMLPHNERPEDKARFDSAAVFKDTADPNPQRRYKMVNWQYNDAHYFATDKARPSGCYAAFSPDGLRWREHPEPLLLLGHGVGDTLNVMHDVKRKKFVMFVKIFITEEGQFILRDGKGRCVVKREEGQEYEPWENPGIRYRGQSESDDFLNWSTPRWILPSDKKEKVEPQLYNNTGFLYGSQYLGLLQVYSPETTNTVDVQLVSSRDGRHWQRCFDGTPVLPCGEQDGDWDFGFQSTSSEAPIQVGEELWLYYSGMAALHAGGAAHIQRRGGDFSRCIGLAKLRLDGFVSINAGRETGTLTTVPIQLRHSHLWVNAQVGGTLSVEVLKLNNDPITELSGENAGNVTGDGVRLAVQFRNLPALAKVLSEPVRLRFRLNDSSLFAFWCEE